MKTGDLARLFGVSPTTVQNWTREFETYLSESKGKHRRYTENDALLLATIAKLSADGLNYNAIRQKIDDGYRVESPSDANFGIDTRMVPAAAVEQIIDSTEIRAELEATKRERDKLLDQNQRYEERIEELTDKIAQLQHDLGLAQGELNYRRQLDEKRGD